VGPESTLTAWLPSLKAYLFISMSILGILSKRKGMIDNADMDK
jgi:hypothetical protein